MIALLLAVGCAPVERAVTREVLALEGVELPEGYGVEDLCLYEEWDAFYAEWEHASPPLYTQGGWIVWCDLPGRQATKAGRTYFVPLLAIETAEWALCHYADGCTPLDRDEVNVSTTPVWWECETGHEVYAGTLTAWDCTGFDVEGSMDHYISIAWDVGLVYPSR